MNLFIFVLIPIATILLSIVLERELREPVLVSITIFALYLIIFFILFLTGVITDLALGIITVIIYAIIAFVTAVISRFVRCICKNILKPCCSKCPRTDSEDILCEDECNCNQDSNLLTISARCNNGNTQDLLSVNSNCMGNEDESNNEMLVSDNMINNQINKERYSQVRRCYRR